MVVSSYSETYA